MTKPQLGSLTRFNSAANTVTSETINTDTNLFHFGIPLTQISENVSHRTPFKVINIAGNFRGIESELKAFIEEIEGVAIARQTQNDYTNALNKVYQVKINNFTYVTAQNTNTVGYTIQFYDETI